MADLWKVGDTIVTKDNGKPEGEGHATYGWVLTEITAEIANAAASQALSAHPPAPEGEVVLAAESTCHEYFDSEDGHFSIISGDIGGSLIVNHKIPTGPVEITIRPTPKAR